MLIFNRLLILIIFFASPVFSFECEVLKDKVLVKKNLTSDEIEHIKIKIKADDLCFQNLVGIMTYVGNYYPKDKLKAAQIFHQLSQKNYPDAEFNYAMAATKRLDQIPEDVLVYIVGIYHKYAGSGNRGIGRYHGGDTEIEISILAKNLGKKYIKSLNSLSEQCNKNDSCTLEMKNLDAKKIKSIEKDFYVAINNASQDIGIKRYNLSQESKSKADTLVLVLSLGAAAYALSSSYNYNYTSTNSTVNSNACGGWFRCGFEWNPLNLNQMNP